MAASLDPDNGERELGVIFKFSHVTARFLTALFEIGILTLVSWLYATWRTEPTVRVDILFPCFFPVAVGIIMSTYETISLLALKRRRPINPVAICFDIAVAAVGVFCFLAISMSGYDQDRKTGPDPARDSWVYNVNLTMIFMMTFSLLHACFIIMAAVAVVYIAIHRRKVQRDELVAANQAEMVEFTERQKRRAQAKVSAIQPTASTPSAPVQPSRTVPSLPGPTKTAHGPPHQEV
ncbi:hypothetical protein B0H67DRAFT_548824 [Lasiosphaeris hirsuta]|uniref:Uncharacterized protein n=1 Tax=Lasiosphaeris hirsuta TaxID=260670 RepID=A0AA40EBB1_9PEZI|nr:hypothetical protein B0H67DRAFT_548824 [Lasiosphaeris hirsuta]